MRTNRILRAATRPLRRLSHTKLAGAARDRQVGQVLPIFAVMSVVLLGGAALLTDVAWWWTNELRMQRAADAASLAGAVYLPADQSRAYAAALAEAAKNGYTNAGNVVVTPRRDPDNLRKLIVDIDAPVQTNFARVFCWQGGPCLQKVDIGVTGAAEFVLPVPMGSPENYYGVFGDVRGMTSTRVVTTTTPHADRGWSCGTGDSTTPPPVPPDNPWLPANGCNGPDPNEHEGGAWTTSSGSLDNALNNNDNDYAQVSVTNLQPQPQHQWSTFGAQAGIPNPAAGESVDIVGLQVRLSDAHRTTNCSGGNANIRVQLSWDAGGTWTAPLTTGSLGTNASNGDFILGSDAAISWQPPLPSPPNPPQHTWTRADFADGPAANRTFRVRLTGIKLARRPPSRSGWIRSMSV